MGAILRLVKNTIQFKKNHSSFSILKFPVTVKHKTPNDSNTNKNALES